MVIGLNISDRGNKMNTLYKTTMLGIALISLTAASAFASTYVGGATFVGRDDSAGQVLDAGGVMCNEGSGDGVGGACFPWSSLAPGQVYVSVDDVVAGSDVAFQVCVDNNGDGLCGDVGGVNSPGISANVDIGGCRDTILFSHDDQGNFFNPLGALPTAFPQGCDGGFPGWIVFICAGAHDDGQTTHTHEVTSGTVTPAYSGSGTGTFCGGIGKLNIPPKPYVIIPDGATPAQVDALIAKSMERVRRAAEDVSNFIAFPEIRDLPSL